MTNFTQKAKDMNIEQFHIKATRCFLSGNTYHKVYISAAINGKWVELGESEITYGYGGHYFVTAGDWLKENGFLNIDSAYEVSSFRFREDNFISSEYSDVKRKRDM